MNNEQLEELEALSYIFTENEMERDNNVFEFCMPECRNLKIQIIWPKAYPECALMLSLIDSRLTNDLKKAIESECNLLAETLAGSAATFSVYDFLRENLEKWGLPDAFDHEEPEEPQYEEEKSKKPNLTKAQKRKLYQNVDLNGDKLRGWNWVDIVSHVLSK